ncbi:MAG: hypothetical protein Q7J73_06335 [Dehalococcoidales bacterium]|nr:hypothetical protein [Dehalococcoidales bacterium]
MKRLYFTLGWMAAIFLLAAIATKAFGVTPTGGTITVTARTNTTALVQISTHPTAVDSVFICYIRVTGAADTIFVALTDTVVTSKLVSGLPPGLNANFFLLTRQGAGGPSAISNKETETIYGPEIEATPNTNLMELVEQLVRAVSWRMTSILNTFTLSGTAASDSTGHYKKWKRNTVIINARQAGDSVKVMMYTFYGYRDMTQAGATVGFVSSGDSLNINAPGTHALRLSGYDAPAMYFKFQSYSGNGKDDSLTVYLDRKRN